MGLIDFKFIFWHSAQLGNGAAFALGVPSHLIRSSVWFPVVQSGEQNIKAPTRHIKEWHIKYYFSDPGSTLKPAQIHRKSVVGGGPAAGNRRLNVGPRFWQIFLYVCVFSWALKYGDTCQPACSYTLRRDLATFQGGWAHIGDSHHHRYRWTTGIAL